MSRKQSPGKSSALFVSGALRLELISGRKPRLDWTLKITPEQAEVLKDPKKNARLLDRITTTVRQQNVKFPIEVKIERMNFESPLKGGYFGRIVCTVDEIRFDAAVNLKQTLTKIRSDVVEITGHRFRRSTTKSGKTKPQQNDDVQNGGDKIGFQLGNIVGNQRMD